MDAKLRVKIRHGKKFFLSLMMASAIFISLPVSQAKAACGYCTDCNTWKGYILQEMNLHKTWMVNEWWTNYVKVAMQKFTDQTRDSLIANGLMIGAFLDGESELNSLRALQELNANAMKDYAVSDSICKFGTLSRSLAASQSKAKGTQIVLAERSQNRQLGHKNMASAEKGGTDDRIARYNQFIEKFCDPEDYGGAMKIICTSAPADKLRNIDINYTRLIDGKRTLDMDLTDGSSSATPTDDENAVIALANNLYSHDVMERIDAPSMGAADETDSRTTYLDQRAIVAKRSVAENSFNAIVGMKSVGADQSATYMKNVLKQLGITTSADLKKYLGDKPSYDVQMEVLTKKLYQDPSFYANLMDTPANVERQYAALQSFGLMQRRDIFETLIRSEMLLSVILEMEITKYQDSIQNRQN